MGGGLLFALVADRDLSVVVFGATGVTGRQVAAYLAQRAEEADVRWAAAGRDPAKVERVLGEIGVTAPEIVTADIGDPGTLEAMASRTRVVLDLVGPYTLYGQPVIEACIAAGAHYADLTGEIPFVRRMIDNFQSQAEAAGVKIVNVSGFEALPADLAVLLAAETARSRWDEALATVDLDASLPTPAGAKPADMISGGTLQSLAEATSDERAELAADPGALITDPELAQRVRDASPIAFAPRFNAEGDVIGPMLPSPFINPAVIHRTAALVATEERPLEPFRYREGVAVDSVPAVLPLRYAVAGALAGVQAGVRALSRARLSTRQRLAGVMRRRLPSSGFGPKGERLNAWTWKLAVNARTTGGHQVRIDLDADGHPGYLSTARILGEAGLLLAEDGATPARSGFLTPAAALGTTHLDRFERAEMRLSVSS
jgi:short subunit dehydrogenase-like uncharacterized protein